MRFVPFPFARECARERGKKKAGCSVQHPARRKPIWLAAGKVNRVMRIGAFSWVRLKKLSWKCLRSEFDPEKGLFPQRAGQSRPRPEGVLPSFAPFWKQVGTFRGPKSAARSIWTSHPMKWSWHLNALPRFGPPSARRRAGEVSEHGRMRPGADREARQGCLCSPYKRKADVYPS